MVRRVDRERWLDAQRWELDLWTRETGSDRRARLRRWAARLGVGRWIPSLLGSGDDWNHWWKQQFDDYSFVPARLGEVLELGCGPFTNVRLLREGRRFERVVCSDPLILRYISLRGTWIAEAYRRGIVEVDDHPAEECPFPSDRFDLVVMINVLDHVRDLDLSLANAIRVTNSGGLFVLGQDLTDEGDRARIGEDIGHPIRTTHSELDGYTVPAFEPVIHRVLDRDSGRNPEAHYGTYIFVGRKR